MALSKAEKAEVMESLEIEIANMFDRLGNQYSRPHHAEHALLLPELEAYIKAGLLEHPTPL